MRAQVLIEETNFTSSKLNQNSMQNKIILKKISKREELLAIIMMTLYSV